MSRRERRTFSLSERGGLSLANCLIPHRIFVVRGPVPRKPDSLSSRNRIFVVRGPVSRAPDSLSRHSMAGDRPPPYEPHRIFVVRVPVPREPDLLSSCSMAGDRPPPYGPLSRHSMAGDRPPPYEPLAQTLRIKPDPDGRRLQWRVIAPI